MEINQTRIKVDKPVTIGMALKALATILGIFSVPLIIYLVGLSNAKTEHAIRIERIEAAQEQTGLKLDKMDNKLDRIMYKQEYQSK